MRIHFIQPALPKYRIPFFNAISRKFEIIVYASDIDFLGVRSSHAPYLKSIGNFFNLRLVFWQRGLNLFDYKKNDVVVISGNPRVLNYMLLFLILKLRGIKSIWWGHGWSAGSRGILSEIRIKMMHLASAVVLYTEYEKKQIEKFGINNCFALNNGLDSYDIEQAIASTNFEKNYDLPIKSLVFIGRLTKKAELDFLLKALSKTKSGCILNIIGSGEKELELKELAAGLNISHRVNWFGSKFNENDIAKIMLCSHAFIYAGSVGLSLIHAFNYGLPAIVHDEREHHMPEYSAFENNINGFSFIRGDVEDAAKKIDLLFSLPINELIRLSKNAKDTVQHSFNVDDMTLRFFNLINDLSSCK